MEGGDEREDTGANVNIWSTEVKELRARMMEKLLRRGVG
jgi:hypothetical protein